MSDYDAGCNGELDKACYSARAEKYMSVRIGLSEALTILAALRTADEPAGDLRDAELLGLAGEYDQSDSEEGYQFDAHAMLQLLRAVANRSAPPPAVVTPIGTKIFTAAIRPDGELARHREQGGDPIIIANPGPYFAFNHSGARIVRVMVVEAPSGTKSEEPMTPVRCHCGAHAWPDYCAQMEDSHHRLHTLRGCQPTTTTKEGEQS